MKAYVATTAVIFSLLTLLHAWRAFTESPARDPEFLIITLLAAALAIWGIRVWIGMNRRQATP